MKKILTALCVFAISLGAITPAQAQVKELLGIGNHLGVQLGVGSTGVSVEAATPITPFLQARAGVSVMPGFHMNVSSDVYGQTSVNGATREEYVGTVDLTGSLKRVQGSLIFNVYPLGNRFPLFVAVGGYFGGRNMVGIEGMFDGMANLNTAHEKGYVEIGDYQLPLGPNGEIKGGLRTKSFRPYFGIGTGRPCPVGRVNFTWEIGVQIQGKPYVWDEINNCKVNLAEIDKQTDDDFQKVMNNFTVYPVLKFCISGRIF